MQKGSGALVATGPTFQEVLPLGGLLPDASDKTMHRRFADQRALPGVGGFPLAEPIARTIQRVPGDQLMGRQPGQGAAVDRAENFGQHGHQPALGGQMLHRPTVADHIDPRHASAQRWASRDFAQPSFKRRAFCGMRPHLLFRHTHITAASELFVHHHLPVRIDSSNIKPPLHGSLLARIPFVPRQMDVLCSLLAAFPTLLNLDIAHLPSPNRS